MQNQKNAGGAETTRKKALSLIGILSIGALFSSLFSRKKKNIAALECGPAPAKKTVKLLTQDGRLVEADVSAAKIVSKKITDKQLQDWVKKS